MSSANDIAKAGNAALLKIRFREPARADSNFHAIAKRLSPGVTAVLPALLIDIPDPDNALNQFERLVTSVPASVVRSFDKHHSLIHYALVVFGYSRYLGETLIQNTDLFPSLLRQGALDRSYSREDFREHFARFKSRSLESDISKLLARFKRREYIRILLRDVLEIATLAETTAEISALADVLIEEAFCHCETELQRKYGVPQRLDAEQRLITTPFAVLALGKLGGGELNYSSDLDLIFIYGDGERDDFDDITNREYFVRLAQQVTDALSRVTSEGIAFRVDLRLRPMGREGEAALPLSHTLRYYADTAHDWELQAMIKVRYCAGDAPLARRFIRGLQPYVYKDRLNFAAIETALAARDRTLSRRRKSAAPVRDGIDVKLDRGGIRDIEFLVQCLQRTYGGKEKWLRSSSTLFSLAKLHDKGHISGSDFHELTNVYEFLRKVEHRLQMRHGQQTHCVGKAEADLECLSCAIGFVPAEAGCENVVRHISLRMASVADIYNRIIHQQHIHRDAEEAGIDFRLTSNRGFVRDHSEIQLLERLAVDSPAIAEIVHRPELSIAARRNLMKLLASAFTTSERYATLLRHPVALGRALPILGQSELLTSILTRNPEELSALNELRDVEVRSEGQELFSSPTNDSPAHHQNFNEYLTQPSLSDAERNSLLRQRYRQRIFASGARDVICGRDIFTSLAETSSAAVEAIAGAAAVADTSQKVTVCALGRLGSNEFDALSDADLLFLRNPDCNPSGANRIAEKIVQILSAYTNEGSVFPVDTRLRPRGSAGELTVTPAQLNAYFEEEALPWEALSFTKLRFVAGSAALADEAVRAVASGCARFSTDTSFGSAVFEMRRRLQKAEDAADLKTRSGGLYDIDFLCSFLAIQRCISGIAGNLRTRLRRLAELRLVASEDLEVLLPAAELFRACEHAVRLVTGRAVRTLPHGDLASRATEALVQRILGRAVESSLEAELQGRSSEVRSIFERVLKA